MNANLIRMYAPCSIMDVEAMQTWLEDMAMEGLLLKKRGNANAFLFYKIEPLKIRYRLTPVSNELEHWNQEPDFEGRTLADAFGWDYVCTLGYFHVYRSYNEEDRELNTDPAVHAETLYQLRRKAMRAACAALASPVLYVLIVWLFSGQNQMLRTMVRDGFMLYSLLPLSMLFITIRGIRDAVGLLRLQRRWRSGELTNARKEWRPRAKLHRIATRGAYALAVCLILACTLNRHIQWDQMRYQDLPAEAGTVPFLSVMELAGQSDATDTAERLDVGYLRSWDHILAPANYEWAEIVDVTNRDGTVGRFSIEVDYHEARYRWIAEGLAKEYLAEAEQTGTAMEFTAGAEFDQVYGYLDSRGDPAVVLRKGNTVVRACFVRMDYEDPCLNLEYWVECLENSLA